ncbi:MAG: glycoside hydrolase family 28 protein, partial [Alistipes sp.]|nr:glycoside hydrolase family 28 protein [Alistipes sp.]
DIHISNVYCRNARRAMYFNGLPEMNVENVLVENTAVYAQTGAQINESTGVTLRNVSVVPQKGAALMINNAKDIDVENFSCPEGLAEALIVTGSRNRDVVVESAQISAANTTLSKGAADAVTVK